MNINEQLALCDATVGPFQPLNLEDVSRLCYEIKRKREEVQALEAEWMDGVFRIHMPPHIYRWAHSEIPFALRKAAEYIDKENWMIEYHPNKRVITRGGKPIATLEHNFINP